MSLDLDLTPVHPFLSSEKWLLKMVVCLCAKDYSTVDVSHVPNDLSLILGAYIVEGEILFS